MRGAGERAGICAFALVLLPATVSAQALTVHGLLRTPEFLAAARVGFDHMYNLEYDQAAQVFEKLEKNYPQHPAPPIYVATVVWLRELFERQELELDRFVAPGYFTKETDRRMDASSLQLFNSKIEQSRTLAEAILEKNEDNLDARYFLGVAEGILASFEITINRSYRRAFGHGKQAYKFHKEIVEKDPSFADAYMSVGLYEYVVANLPWYIKWFATIIGYRGSEERGFEYLQKAVDDASFVSDDARVLQMVLFVREERFADALKNAEFLHSRYPRSFILHLNRAQTSQLMGDTDAAVELYKSFLDRVEARAPNYHKASLTLARLQIGQQLLNLKQPELSRQLFQKNINGVDEERRQRALSHLGLGQALDLLGRRQEAINQYRRVLELEEFDDSHDEAKDYLQRPYRLKN